MTLPLVTIAVPQIRESGRGPVPVRAFIHSAELCRRLGNGTARRAQFSWEVKITRESFDASRLPHIVVTSEVWIPVQVDDFVPDTGLWDVLKFWQDHATPTHDIMGDQPCLTE